MCKTVLGKDEMILRGGRWRHRSLIDPDKLERLLAEIRGLQLEGKAIRNPGAYAEDLWKRWV